MARIETDFDLLGVQLRALLSGETDALANSANFVALLWNSLPAVNWLGLYVARGDELVLGPFQGKPACVRLPLGKGVCGTAATERRAMRVDDVHAFAGHIACDAESRSELVLPLVSDNELLGVLDIDSPQLARFSATDEAGVAKLCEVYLATLALPKGKQSFI